MEIGRFMGYLHPVLIHFPIVLLLVAVLLEGLEFVRPDYRLAWTARLLLLLGTVSTLFAFVCGNFAEIWAARSGTPQSPMELHEFLATATSWLFVGLTAWRVLMKNSSPRLWRAVWLAVAFGACVLLGYTGYHGASLVYDHGAAVHNIGLQRPPTDDDLSTLLQRQDAPSIVYSNMMHHIFGWMVLLLSGLLLVDQLSPRLGEKARRFGPILLLAGGVFLLIFSDQDAWPLYHVRPFRPIVDKEVLLHKTYALLLLLIGARGIWLSFRRNVGATVQGGCVNAQLMAVFSLVGGALLFTHVHSAAPYANVAVGVYIHHTALGLGALLIGAIKLMDDMAKRPARWRALAFPAFMCVEAVLLMNYNEGLPWFLGYGDLATAPAHGGNVAPLGPYRAELKYDAKTSRIEMFVMERTSEKPVRLPVIAANLVVRVGDEPTELNLPGNPGIGGMNDHFAATASFLRGTPIFQSQARIRVGNREYVADFEPWVDGSMLSGKHSIAPFVCPMHPDQGGSNTGRCRKCGMPLQPNRSRSAGVLHDAEFATDFSVVPAAPIANAPAQLTFTPRNTVDGHVLGNLQVVHTKKLHLIVVSRDLSYFDHVHPEPRPDGSLVLTYSFPHGGEFDLFADLTPFGEANQVFRIPVMVNGEVPPTQSLSESQTRAKLVGDYRVALSSSPEALLAGEEAALACSISLNGKPVTDLSPYLGAAGHCVILSQDTNTYLHSHPLEPGLPVTGPDVTFHTQFKHPGLYKVWTQFNHHGRILTADFVLRVQ